MTAKLDLINKNDRTLRDFVRYCEEHPQLRFWQALSGWAGVGFIYTSSVLINDYHLFDTFYWTGKDS